MRNQLFKIKENTKNKNRVQHQKNGLKSTESMLTLLFKFCIFLIKNKNFII